MAIYQGEDWYVGQMLDKDEEPEAEKGENDLYVTFMEKIKGDLLKWPRKPDDLNMLKDNILFACQTLHPVLPPSLSEVQFHSLEGWAQEREAYVHAETGLLSHLKISDRYW